MLDGVESRLQFISLDTESVSTFFVILIIKIQDSSKLIYR